MQFDEPVWHIIDETKATAVILFVDHKDRSKMYITKQLISHAKIRIVLFGN